MLTLIAPASKLLAHFFSEEMTRYEIASSKGPTISPLTLELLEDSSWYISDFKIATDISFGRGVGYQFVQSSCHVNEMTDQLASPFSGFHCSNVRDGL
jgi:hypothetical protein